MQQCFRSVPRRSPSLSSCCRREAVPVWQLPARHSVKHCTRLVVCSLCSQSAWVGYKRFLPSQLGVRGIVCLADCLVYRLYAVACVYVHFPLSSSEGSGISCPDSSLHCLLCQTLMHFGKQVITARCNWAGCTLTVGIQGKSAASCPRQLQRGVARTVCWQRVNR